MKADIHPQIHPVVFIDTSTDAEFITTSTLTSDEKKKINGVDHYVIKVEISSTSHPFYTGKRKLVDTAGRVDKFRQRAEKAKEMKAKTTKKVDEGLDEVLHNEKEEKSEKKEEKETKKGILNIETGKTNKEEESKKTEKKKSSKEKESSLETKENTKEKIIETPEEKKEE